MANSTYHTLIYDQILTIRQPTLSMEVGLPQTVLEAIRTVMPYGTDPKEVAKVFGGQPVPRNPRYSDPPYNPFDLFAVTGHLIEIGSGYHWLVAAKSAHSAPAHSRGITRSSIQKLEKAGMKWSTDYATPNEVRALWTKLLQYSHDPVSTFATGLAHVSPKPPKWLDAAYKLFVIADSASEGAGYWADLDGVDADKIFIHAANHSFQNFDGSKSNGHVRVSRQVASITTAAVDDDVVCVQPKARTSSLGCSLRNLSHNLALLPPRGKINACWMPPWQQRLNEYQADANVLLIPYPYRLKKPLFNAHAEFGDKDGDWGWFELEQNWLPSREDDLIEFVDALIESAKKHAVVTGLMFPEYSLNYKLFEKIAEHIRRTHQSIEFIVAGSRDNCENHIGNFALSTHFYDDEGGAQGHRAMVTTSRPKHHRWALNAAQLKTYDLERFFPSTSIQQKWWEKISVPPRQIHFLPMRSGSIYSVLICEDLARTDPAHDPMKSIGPNLVFVILFDGPQLEWRWSTRQATSLSEDPGSSVLTLTSRALVERWNAGLANPNEASWAVATWKDPKARARMLDCKPGWEAVLVKLRGIQTPEYSLDGRMRSNSFEWTMIEKGEEPIQLDRSNSHHQLLLKKMGAD